MLSRCEYRQRFSEFSAVCGEDYPSCRGNGIKELRDQNYRTELNLGDRDSQNHRRISPCVTTQMEYSRDFSATESRSVEYPTAESTLLE